MRRAAACESFGSCRHARNAISGAAARLEDIAYLVTVFGIFLRAAGLEYHEEAEEVRMFVDAAKLAHMHLRLEADFRRRASGT